MRRNRPGLLALALAVAVVLPLVAPPALAVDPSRSVPADRPAEKSAAGGEGPLAVSGGTTGVAVEASPAQTVVRNGTNTTNYLTVDDGDVEREAFANASLDVGHALAADATRLQGTLRTLSLQRSFDQSADEAARVALVQNETTRIEARIEALKQQQQRAIEAFNQGEIDDRTLLRRLAAIDVESRQLQARLRTIRDIGDGTAEFRIPNDLRTRINNVRAEPVAVRGKVRAHVGRSLAGEHDSSVYILTSGEGIVVAVIDERSFLRDAYLADRRQPGSPDRFRDGSLPRISVANQRAAVLYPWIYSIPAPPSVRAFGNSSVYNVSDTHPHGRLVTYLDGATEDVYREVQVKQLDAVPTRTLTASNGTLSLRVNRTHATGPMHLSVTDDRPVDATVLVNGQSVGTTGDDGTLWTITPYDSVRIEVRTADGDVVRTRFFAR